MGKWTHGDASLICRQGHLGDEGQTKPLLHHEQQGAYARGFHRRPNISRHPARSERVTSEAVPLPQQQRIRGGHLRRQEGGAMSERVADGRNNEE